MFEPAQRMEVDQMSGRRGLIICLILLISIFTATVFAEEDYYLAAGDILDIEVYGYQDLQFKDLTIRPDGKLDFPLVGEVPAAGLTSADLCATLTKSLVEYVKNPQVTVNIVKFHTIRVYVLGEVTRPGLYEITKQHNLLDAIAMAGGHTIYTAKKAVYVVHKTTGQYVQINLNNLLTKGDLTQNCELADGDVVYLAENGMNFVREILPLIYGFYDIGEVLK